jgi:hypothetical protein
VHAIVAARPGLHVMCEGASGSGLTTLAKFVALFRRRKLSDGSHSPKLPPVLLGQESTVESSIGAFRPQPLTGENDDMTKLVRWADGPLL